MKNKDLALVLVYEPPTAKGRPVPIARITDQTLMVRAARSALGEAQAKANALARADELLGEVERAEVKRLQEVLILLIPGLKSKPKSAPLPIM